jgi:subtilisin family serine protease
MTNGRAKDKQREDEGAGRPETAREASARAEPAGGTLTSGGRPQRYVREGEEATASRDAADADGFGFTFEEEDVTPDLDPQLQHVLMSARAGRIDPALVQESEDGSLRVDVTGELHDPTQPVPGLEVTQSVGNLITGSCEVEAIEAVRQHPNVKSLKGATKVAPNVQFSVPEIRASRTALRDALPQGVAVPDGAGVIVGVVDFGGDFAHENFRKPDGTTRLLYLWDQNGSNNSMSPEGYPYGREFTAAHINEALNSSDPYGFLAYDPGSRSHGTHVMDTAAGNGRGTGRPGVAPKADLIFVELAGGDFGPEESFGNSRRLQEAVKYIFDRAAQLGRQAVINLSLGTHGGPHDGSTPVEKWFDGLLQTPGRAIVISAGNSWERASHTAGRIAPGQTRTLGWEKSPTDLTPNELEVWYNGDAALEATLVFPTGQRFGPMPVGAKPRVIKNSSGQKAGEMIHRAGDPLNGDNVLNIFLGRELPSGTWGVELRAVGQRPANFHSWIERDDRGQSRFVAADDLRTHTIGSISCGRDTITVGSYKPKVLGRDLSSFSAEGPSRDGKQKPEVSAPGDGIVAANSGTGNGTVTMSGTSMAAPHVTGVVALLMQAAGRPLTVAEIRQAVVGAARRNPPQGNAWNSRYGNGRVDCAAAVLSLLPQSPELQPLAEPASSGATPASSGAIVAGGNGVWPPVAPFLEALLERTQNATVRVKFQIEAEYTGK